MGHNVNTTIYRDKVGEWIIKLGFKYYYVINNKYVGGNENKDKIWYIWRFIDIYLLLYWCMFRWIQMKTEESEKYQGQKTEKFVPVSVYQYKLCNPNYGSNDVVDLSDYHVATIPQFQDILEKLARKEILEVG